MTGDADQDQGRHRLAPGPDRTPGIGIRPRPGRPLAITGLGCIGAPGRGISAQLRALSTGQSGLGLSPGHRLPLGSMVQVGLVRAALPRVPGRTAALAVAAGMEALESAGLGPGQRGEIGVAVGSSTAGLPESERDFLERDPARAWPSYRRQQTHCITAIVARSLGCAGPRSTHSVACASAACAIIEAMELVRGGICPAVLAVGCDALTRLTMAGFYSLQLIDPAGCRPLIAERAGMSLGEGAAALLIEDPDHARRRGAPVIASLAGWGLRADGYHATSPDPGAVQLATAIRLSLEDGGLAADDIGYVNLHGTGTRDNDVCEIEAVSRIFGAVPAASAKRTYGHTMGAAAAIEAVAICLALRDQRMFPSAGIELGTPLAGLDLVRTVRDQPLEAACSTTLAFGGVNASLVFSRAQRCG